MKFRNAMISLAFLLAAGCDTMDNDVDANISINNDPIYILRNGGVIDLPARIIAPGKVKVEITTSGNGGKLTDLGKGLIQYLPLGGTTKDYFRFRVYSENDRVLADDSIGIIVPPTDTTFVPCDYVLAQNDSLPTPIDGTMIDVTRNDKVCTGSLTVTIDTPPTHGKLIVIGHMVFYIPGPSFTNTDQFIYKATSSDPSIAPGYAMVWVKSQTTLSIPVPDPSCALDANDDFYTQSVSDSSIMYLDILANDVICMDTSKILISPVDFPGSFIGDVHVDYSQQKLKYKPNTRRGAYTDTIYYLIRRTITDNSFAKAVVTRK